MSCVAACDRGEGRRVGGNRGRIRAMFFACTIVDSIVWAGVVADVVKASANYVRLIGLGQGSFSTKPTSSLILRLNISSGPF